MKNCPYCGSSDLATNDSCGEKACRSCGQVVEESAIVEGVTFSEGSGVVGQYVSFMGGTRGSQASREQSLARGRMHIERIADILRLSVSQQESAHRVYVMAVQRTFTVGRQGPFVAAACLYVICRRERSPHMMIDFSDVLRVPVRTLTQTFMKLVNTLHLPVPTIDPSLFMERYTTQLNLGDKTLEVAATGVRIIQAMNRDWVATGRRPTGLCGAALLISARYHGFKMNTEEVVKIVRLSSHTITKRLYEFRQTSTASLTAEEFETTDLLTLPILRGPPCFEAAKRRVAREAARKAAIEDNRLCLDDEEESDLDAYELEDAESATTEHFNNDNDIFDDSTGNTDEVELQHFLSAATGGIRGTVCIDSDQDMICSNSPSSEDIESIAAKMLSAFDGIATKAALNEKRVPGSEKEKRKLSEGVAGSNEERKEECETAQNRSHTCDMMPNSTENMSAYSNDTGGDKVENSTNKNSLSQLENSEVFGKGGDTAKGFNFSSDENFGTQSTAACTQSAHLDDMEAEEKGTTTATSDGVFEFAQSDEVFGALTNDTDGDPLEMLLRDLSSRSSEIMSTSETVNTLDTICTVSTAETVGKDFGISNLVGDLNVSTITESSNSGVELLGHSIIPASSDVSENKNVEVDNAEDETLSDISDSEVDYLILSEKERNVKMLIWDEMMKDVMPEVCRRQKQRKRRDREALGRPSTKRKKREKEALPEASSAKESVRIALQRNASSASKMIDDDVLNSLFCS